MIKFKKRNEKKLSNITHSIDNFLIDWNRLPYEHNSIYTVTVSNNSSKKLIIPLTSHQKVKSLLYDKQQKKSKYNKTKQCVFGKIINKFNP